MPVFPESLRIPVLALKRAGLFGAEHEAERFEIVLGAYRVTAAYSHREHAVALFVRRNESARPIAWRHFQVMEKASGYGVRTYLICPQSNDLADAVYLYGDKLFTRQELASYLKGAELHALNTARLRARLEGADGRAPARGEKRLRLEARVQEKETALALRSSSAAGCRSGLPAIGGRGGGQFALPAPIAKSSATRKYDYAAAPLKLYEEDVTEGFTFEDVEEVPVSFGRLPVTRLDDWTLEELTLPLPPLEDEDEMLPRKNCPIYTFSDFETVHKHYSGRAFAMDYVYKDNDIYLRVYWPGPRSRVLCLNVDDDEGPQYVEVLEMQKRRKAGFKCPVTGEWTENLYLRKGRFASLAGQRLR